MELSKYLGGISVFFFFFLLPFSWECVIFLSGSWVNVGREKGVRNFYSF
uniref:Uncharacterized protein n=1 Tax=Rhizophora mucronata TaxID=61149 RepID=A0A2P2MDV7_RHIMU